MTIRGLRIALLAVPVAGIALLFGPVPPEAVAQRSSASKPSGLSAGLAYQQSARQARVKQYYTLAGCFEAAVAASGGVIGVAECHAIRECMARAGYPDNFTCPPQR